MNSTLVDRPHRTTPARHDAPEPFPTPTRDREPPAQREPLPSPTRVPKPPQPWRFRRKHFVALALTAAALAAGTKLWRNSPGSHGGRSGLDSTNQLVFHTVRRGDLPISVVERGTLASQRETRINCDLETVPGQSGTRILWLISNGTPVKKGDLLVEFDAAPLRDRLNTQMVTFEQVKATKIQAAVRNENQKTQNETNLQAAKLRVETTRLGLNMYEDEHGGSYKISIADLDSKIQEAKNQISEAQAALKMKAGRRRGVDLLFKLGYRGKGDLDQAVHEHLQADFALVKATNALAAATANKRKLEQYEYPMKTLELKGAIATAERALSQVERDNEALLAQTEATKTAAERACLTEEEKLNKYKDQLTRGKVYAPHDGLVAHSPDRTPWGRLVAEGELVTERFKILSLPDLGSMQVKLAIHESMLDHVKPDQRAAVRIDAFPDTKYNGTVRSVAVLPTQDGSLSSDVKVYDVIVTIDEQVDHLKPGMTAIVDINVDRHEDVIAVPVQAVMQEEDKTWCYVDGRHGLERRELKLGASSDSMVQIVEGLDAGERIVLNPTTVTVAEPEESEADVAVADLPEAAQTR